MTSASEPQGFTLLEQAIIIAVLGIMAVIAMPNVLRMLDRAKLDHAIAELRSALDETQRAAIRGNKICILTLNLAAGQVNGSCLATGELRIAKDLAIATNIVQSTVPLNSGANSQAAPAIATDMGSGDVGLKFNHGPPKIALNTHIPPTHQSQPKFALNAKAGIRLRVISRQPDKQTLKVPWLLAHHEVCNPSPNHPCTPSSPHPEPSPPPGENTVELPIRFGTLGNPQFFIDSNAPIPTDPSAKIVLYLPKKPRIPKRCVAISNSLGLIRVGRYEGSTEPSEITDSGTCKAEDWQAQ